MDIQTLQKKYNYPNVSIEEYCKDGLEISFEDEYILKVDGVQWMTYNPYTHDQGFNQVFSHYYIAEGHCICTGLGFGIRERWLLNKPEVTKITVIENEKRIIDYHQKHNPDLCEKIDIVHCNARDYVGECDTLLLDHYEGMDVVGFSLDAYEIQKNISSKQTWFWTFETYLSYISFFWSSRSDMFYDYEALRSSDNFINLPRIGSGELIRIMKVYYYHNSHISSLLNSIYYLD